MVAAYKVKSTMNRKRNSDVSADGSTERADLTIDDLISVISKAVRLKKRLGLEYDKIMIVAVIVSRHVVQPDGRKESICGATATDESLRTWNGSTMSLARHLDIPRETMRRKLVELCDDGWLLPGGKSGSYQPSEHLLRTLAEPMSRKLIRGLAPRP